MLGLGIVMQEHSVNFIFEVALTQLIVLRNKGTGQLQFLYTQTCVHLGQPGVHFKLFKMFKSLTHNTNITQGVTNVY